MIEAAIQDELTVPACRAAVRSLLDAPDVELTLRRRKPLQGVQGRAGGIAAAAAHRRRQGIAEVEQWLRAVERLAA